MNTDPATLDRLYNNRALVPDHGAWLQRWAEDSARVRAGVPCALDLRYGPGLGESLDVFPAPRPGAPVLVFLHGGYWRSLDKADHSFLAPAFTALGACVVVPNYALCPGSAAQPVGIRHIVLQCVRAMAWVWRHVAAHGGDPARLVLAGHSAGGHLATQLLTCDWPALAPDLPPGLVRRALSVSGLYDLEPLAHTPFLQDALRLTPAEARALSPARLPRPIGRRLCTVVGADESPAFLAQNTLMRAAWGRGTVPVCEALPGRQHFSVLDALAEPGQRLHTLARRLLGL